MSQTDTVTILLPTFTAGQRQYRLTSLGYSSERYGLCEVCQKPVSDVHYQVEEQYFRHEPRANYAGSKGWTHSGCQSYFGHESCLRSKRRGDLLVHYRDPSDQREYDVHSLPSNDMPDQTAPSFHVRAVASFYVQNQFTDIHLRADDTKIALQGVAIELTKPYRNVREVSTGNPYTAMYEFDAQEGFRFAGGTESGHVLLCVI